MTPEDRAKSVLHFLDQYLSVRELHLKGNALNSEREYARRLLGTALVALVTDAQRKVDE